MNDEVKIKINLKLTGTVILGPNGLDLGTLRAKGTMIPVHKVTEEELVKPQKVITEKSRRSVDEFAMRLSRYFFEQTKLSPPKSEKSSTYIMTWRNPFLALNRQVWTTAGYNYDSKDKGFSHLKYGNLALGAVRRVVDHTLSHMKSEGLSYSSPKSLEKTGLHIASQNDFIQATYEENRAKGVILERPAQ